MTSKRHGFSLKTFFAAGRPDGLQLFEHSQWIGKGLIVPRHEFSRHRGRPELGGTGIYVLCGDNPQTGCQRVFISQISTLRDDLSDVETKDFWDRMIVFAAEGPRLHRAHTDYIEARLIEIADESNAAELDNMAKPKAPPMSEPDTADAEFFIDQILLVSPTLGLRAFESVPAKARSAEAYRLNKSGATATGYHAGGRFVVQGGAVAVRTVDDSCPGYVLGLRESLVERGVLVEDAKQYKLKQEFAFDAPCIAAMVLTASACGDDAWNTPAKSGAASNGAAGREGGAQGVPQVNVKPIRTPEPEPAGGV